MNNPTYRFLGMKRVDSLPHIQGMVAIVTNSGRFFSLPEEIFNELFEEKPTDDGVRTTSEGNRSNGRPGVAKNP